jgi:amidase
VKDLFDVAGYPTAAGNPVLLAASGIKVRTAPLVQTLLDAGAQFVGNANTDELAYSLIGDNIHFGMPINPIYPHRIPDGSSSGSAVAVAAKLADIGLGTDTSGSVRLPAAVNGVVG